MNKFEQFKLNKTKCKIEHCVETYESLPTKTKVSDLISYLNEISDRFGDVTLSFEESAIYSLIAEREESDDEFQARIKREYKYHVSNLKRDMVMYQEALSNNQDRYRLLCYDILNVEQELESLDNADVEFETKSRCWNERLAQLYQKRDNALISIKNYESKLEVIYEQI